MPRQSLKSSPTTSTPGGIRLRSLAIILVLALIAAGCVGQENDAPLGSASATAEVEAQAPPVEAAPGEPLAEEARAPTVVPVEWHGKTGAYACIPSGPYSCISFFSLAQSDSSMEIEARDGTLTLTWDAATPATEQLVLSVYSIERCGERCWSSTGNYYHRVEGGSPLELSLDPVELAEEESLIVYVQQPRTPTPPPVYGFVSLEQEFHVTGEVVVVS